MSKAVVVIPSVASLFIASVALACGGAPPTPASPGYPGTSVAERGGIVSKFVGNANGYSWQRVNLATQETTRVGEVPGHFTGSVETDARANTGIAGQNGKMVFFGDGMAAPLSDDPGAQVDVFGAALSNTQGWNVFTYDSATQTITWFNESSPGRFDKSGALNADCGAVTMLDVAAEDDGSIEGLCGTVAFEVNQSKLQLADLPLQARSLTLGSDGRAIAFGSESKQGGLQAMRHEADGWKLAGSLGTPPAQVVFALDDKSVLVKHEGGFTAYTLHNGTWNASQPLDGNTALTSAGGAPAKVFAGDLTLTVFSTDGSKNGAWTAQSLGELGSPPTAGSPGQEGGCAIVGTALPFALFGLMSMTRFRRKFAAK